jgi:hypothetical protein
MKKLLPDFIAVLAFILISFLYFFPADIENRALFQHDAAAGMGAGQEIKEYREKTGEQSRWTNALFGGMPTYQIAPSYSSSRPLTVVEDVYHLYLPTYVWYAFVMMLGFYILLRVIGMAPWLSTLGALVWGFSSYFFILIAAGHIWKFVTLAYIPPTIAGLVLTYRGRYLAGGLMTALFLALQIKSNHVQMSYYFIFVMLFMALAYLAQAIRNKELTRFWKASATLVAAAVVGVALNLSNLYHTYEYSKQTMRGKSELTLKTDAGAQSNGNGGLEKEYITQWSYGIGETLTLLVPNVRGGASVPLSESETAMKKADPTYTSAGLYSQITQYFGDQPMTSGPVYVGAFVLALFILGCFVVKGPMKWALLGATIFSIVLSWGKNFMLPTDLFIDYVPMYNKFRAVSSILVIAEFTIPLLAIMALKEIIDHPDVLRTERRGLIVSVVLTVGIAFLLYVAPSVLVPSYIPAQEMAALKSGLPAEHVAPVVRSLNAMREALVTADALNSLLVLCAGFVLLFAYGRGKLKAVPLVVLLVIICGADMWRVNKRYLHDDMFVPKSEGASGFALTPTDEFILQDKSLDYRVLNFAGSTFNENNTSYHHKSVGGYHAAKLQRYQDMIDLHISGEMKALYNDIIVNNGEMDSIDGGRYRVLNMLNTKYVILPTGRGGETIPLENPFAYGNAWFVGSVKYVADANEEIKALDDVSPREVAVVDSKFRSVLGDSPKCAVEGNSVKLVSYAPNKLSYDIEAAADGVVVFSEIYYPGWRVTVDGKEAELARADYILRALPVKAGSHKVEMSFNPKSIAVTDGIAYAAYAILIIGAVVLIVRSRKRTA